MKVLAINGSPRKTWNTATLLNKALEGAASEGAQTEITHLYDLNYKGCTSCFACRLKGGESYGNCAYQDELTPVLKNIREVDALILGSPIYFGTVTGEMKSFIDRLLFPYQVFDANMKSLFPKKIPVGFIYTMGAHEARMKGTVIDQHIQMNEFVLKSIFGASESIVITETRQFDDDSKYASSFRVAGKERSRMEARALDREKSYNMGVKFAIKGLNV